MELKKFEDLQTSTTTVMVYSNVIFDSQKLFSQLKITPIEAPLTKKKNIDKKKIVAEKGEIISIQAKTKLRGLDLRKKKKIWCTICRPEKKKGNKNVKVFTIKEFLVKEGDEMKIMYNCNNCQKNYSPEQLKKISHFLNQITIVMSIGKQPHLNIMMFKDNFKFAGCKNINDAIEAVEILWRDHIFPCKDVWKLKKGETEPKFVFDVAMRNVDFRLNFPIDRQKLNKVMNMPKYQNNIHMSQYEESVSANVNIKMHKKIPSGYKYKCLVLPEDDDTRMEYLETIPYKNDKKQNKKSKYVTFIVFASSETILSGKYDENMKEMYDFFCDIIRNHKPEIEEKIKNITQTDIKKITDRIAKISSLKQD